MPTSVTQQRLLDRIRNGAKLSFESCSGKYKLVEGSITKTIDPRTVEALRGQHLIEGTLTGQYSIAKTTTE